VFHVCDVELKISTTLDAGWFPFVSSPPKKANFPSDVDASEWRAWLSVVVFHFPLNESKISTTFEEPDPLYPPSKSGYRLSTD
jgi:hypothetical protein